MKDSQLKIVGITACSTGIAHTFIAASALEKEGLKRGHSVKIEKQGKEFKDILTAADIEEADVVIIAADVAVQGLKRFSNKPIYKTSTKATLKDLNLIFEKLQKFEQLPVEKSIAQASTNPLASFQSSTLKR